ncbi:3-oxoacyl-[acyl-carrier protein] reductase [Serinicoccus hydrothermalis]|uniref:3-oxoacyl-[acyl-carrier protein] reductase n=1 Tax=Serinicoccus hydrothermalis TaxID=1758689 RepID=A0A1B1N9H5_9MICO|nr:SDR family NAD(P)-dependent oxidoreductase [Serinicoccus hydrothermalis]ANS78076.1 3-oxoacyl-[acyl-carrier protein] reductase [Serinicoccus hydrothermalis]
MSLPVTPRPVSLVAGGSRGLGLLVAQELAQRGYDVAVCARHLEETRRGAEIAESRAREEAGADAGRVHAYECDVADRETVQAWVAQVEGDLGPVEVAIHVAGIIQVGPAETMTFHHFDQALGTMLVGPLNTLWSVLPGMRERGHGRLGVVSSIGGVVAPPHLLPYSTAKFGATGLTQGLASELAGTGVTATTIVPGLMRTGSHENAQFTGDRAAEYAWFAPAASLPLLSMDAERAARRMVDGVLAGRPMVVLTPLAKIGMRVHGLMPATTIRVMGLTSRLLPSAPADRDAARPVTGRTAAQQLGSDVVSRLTTLGRRAAERFNQRGPGSAPTA